MPMVGVLQRRRLELVQQDCHGIHRVIPAANRIYHISHGLELIVEEWMGWRKKLEQYNSDKPLTAHFISDDEVHLALGILDGLTDRRAHLNVDDVLPQMRGDDDQLGDIF